MESTETRNDHPLAPLPAGMTTEEIIERYEYAQQEGDSWEGHLVTYRTMDRPALVQRAAHMVEAWRNREDELAEILDGLV